MGVDPAPAGRNARRLTGRVAQARDILATLAVLRPALVRIDRPWRIIGSAALVLHGIRDVVARDIDLMLDPDDAAMLIDQAGFVRQPQDDRGPFRSHVHARRDDLPMPVEVMGGFAFRNPDGLHPVRVDAPILHDGWPVASLPDLTAMLRLFDRPKDRIRLSLIPESAVT